LDIRVLLPPPWNLLAPLTEESQAEGFALLVRLEREYREGKECFARNGETLLGAFEAVNLMGVCGLTRDPYCEDPMTGRVRHLFVRKSFRRLGVGRALVLEIVRRARENFSTLTLRTHSDHAARFYESIGSEKSTASPSSTHRYNFAPPIS
jgi:GNAT superfamily N-acetyltransferase